MTPGDHEAAAAGFGVVLGRCDDMRAEVFVRYVPPHDDLADLEVAGTLAGPRRGRDLILPVTARLAAVAGGPDPRPPLARAILTEPAFWTPDLPNLYLLEARARRRGTDLASFAGLVGLRRLGTRGRSLWLEGRRFVPRAVVQSGGGFDAAALHAEGLAVAVEGPSAEICRGADEAGVAIIALLADAAVENPAAAAARIANWAAHASVIAAVLPASVSAPEAAAIAAVARRVKGTMLLAHVADGLAPPAPAPPGIDAVVVNLPAGGLPHAAWRDRSAAVPLLACRADAIGPADARRGCDGLQAALAAWGVAGGATRLAWDWAGYIVGRPAEVR